MASVALLQLAVAHVNKNKPKYTWTKIADLVLSDCCIADRVHREQPPVERVIQKVHDLTLFPGSVRSQNSLKCPKIHQMEGSPELSSDSSSPMQDFTYLKLQSGFKGFQKKRKWLENSSLVQCQRLTTNPGEFYHSPAAPMNNQTLLKLSGDYFFLLQLPLSLSKHSEIPVGSLAE